MCFGSFPETLMKSDFFFWCEKQKTMQESFKQPYKMAWDCLITTTAAAVIMIQMCPKMF